MGSLAAFGVGAAGVEVRAEVDERRIGVGQQMQMTTRMERPTATMAFFFPRRRARRR
jgi:hypothetical protein